MKTKKKFDVDADRSVSDFLTSTTGAAMAANNNTIMIGRRLVEAEKGLNAVRFNEYLRRLGLKKRSALFQKLRVIGRNDGALFQFAGKIPPHLDALYQCAPLGKDVLAALVRSERIHQFASDAELRRAIRSYRAASKSRASRK